MTRDTKEKPTEAPSKVGFDWKEVGRDGKAKKPPKKRTAKPKTGDARQKETRTVRLPRPLKTEAVIVRTEEGRTYADLFRKITESSRRLQDVQTTPKTRRGDLLIDIVLKKYAVNITEVVAKALSGRDAISTCRPKVTFEPCGLEEKTSSVTSRRHLTWNRAL